MATMNIFGEPPEYRYPIAVTTDEIGSHLVRVTLVLPGIKKKKFENYASNAEVDVKCGERTVDATVIIMKDKTNPLKKDFFRFNIKQLPGEVNPDRCLHKVEKDKVIINLHKVKSVPWAGDLSRNGLETAKEEEEEEEGKE